MFPGEKREKKYFPDNCDSVVLEVCGKKNTNKSTDENKYRFGCQSNARQSEVSQEVKKHPHNTYTHKYTHTHTPTKRCVGVDAFFLGFHLSLSIFGHTHCLTFTSCTQKTPTPDALHINRADGV